MSRITKKKYVASEVLNNYDLPKSDQAIVKVVQSCGSNLHQVITHEGEEYLVSMPQKFRKHIWIKRGNFIVVESIKEGDKVKGEIVQILLKDQVKYYKNQGVWPKGFQENDNKSKAFHSSDPDLFVNTNRCNIPSESSTEEESSSDDQ